MNYLKLTSIQGPLFLILAQIMVGVGIVFSKYILSSMPIIFVLTIRFMLAALILFPLHWLTPAKQLPLHLYFCRLTKKDWFFILAQALCAGVLFNFFMLSGLLYTDANVAGIITSALPAIIALMSWLLLDEKISGRKMICVFFATLGLIVIASEKLRFITSEHSFFGDAIVFLSLLPEATYYILCKKHVTKLPIFLMSGLINGINAVLLLFILILSTTWNFTISFFDWLVLIILALSSGFFYVFWYFGCQKVDGVMTSLSTAVMPVATVIIAWLLLGEKLSIWELVGMGMIMISIALYAKK